MGSSKVSDQSDGSSETEDDRAFSQIVGERLRGIRRQQRLSLQDVERLSDKEFKASVLGAYERGERSVSVPRLARLAAIYRVPVDQLLPDVSISGAGGEGVSPDDSKVRLDLTKLAKMKSPEAEMIARYANRIQLQRQDFNGRVLTVRGDDMRLIGCILDVADHEVRGRLLDMGLRMAAGADPDTSDSV